jgi:hypothetical protein
MGQSGTRQVSHSFLLFSHEFLHLLFILRNDRLLVEAMFLAKGSNKGLQLGQGPRQSIPQRRFSKPQGSIISHVVYIAGKWLDFGTTVKTDQLGRPILVSRHEKNNDIRTGSVPEQRADEIFVLFGVAVEFVNNENWSRNHSLAPPENVMLVSVVHLDKCVTGNRQVRLARHLPCKASRLSSETGFPSGVHSTGECSAEENRQRIRCGSTFQSFSAQSFGKFSMFVASILRDRLGRRL